MKRSYKQVRYEVLVRFPEEIAALEPFVTTVHDRGKTYAKLDALRLRNVAKHMPEYAGCDFRIKAVCHG